MKSRLLVASALALACSSAWAQDSKVEISGTAGWSFSDGVEGESAVFVPEVGTFNSIGPKDAFSWGLRLGYFVNPNTEIGFLFEQQSTQLEVGGTTSVDVGDFSVRNYHGYFAYNFGEPDASVRPYFLGGLGATQYGSISANVAGVQRDLGGSTNFSSTWGAGVKIFPSGRLGLRLEGRWTPTYIKSDSEGWWCDPYWGCYVVSSAQYSNQFQLGGGLTLRF